MRVLYQRKIGPDRDLSRNQDQRHPGRQDFRSGQIQQVLVSGKKTPGKLKALHLAAVIFLTVSGGPYGLEQLFASTGTQGALLLLLITPLLWDIPTILTVLELNN